MLPPIVAPLRISREANCGQTWSSSGIRPANASSSSLSVRAAPRVATSEVTSSWRSSVSRSMATTYAGRRPRRFTSTPTSVLPATTVASGWSASIVSASCSVAGRRKLPASASITVGAGAGAGSASRALNGSSGAGSASAQAASRIGR